MHQEVSALIEEIALLLRGHSNHSPTHLLAQCEDVLMRVRDALEENGGTI